MAQVDPRLAHDTGMVVERARQIVASYSDMKVPMDRILIRLPATWAAIQAAKQLELDGIATHVVLVYRCGKYEGSTTMELPWCKNSNADG